MVGIVGALIETIDGLTVKAMYDNAVSDALSTINMMSKYDTRNPITIQTMKTLESNMDLINNGGTREWANWGTHEAIEATAIALGAIELAEVVVRPTPQTYLNKALKRQRLNETPVRFKEKWRERGYKYDVRIHEAEPQHGQTGSIMRVSRQKRGAGTEYMDNNGGWHHESTLKPGKKGNVNPNYNEKAAKSTHIQL